MLWKSTFLDLTREVSTAPNVTFKWECLPLTELLLSNPQLMWPVKNPAVERIPPSQLVIYEHFGFGTAKPQSKLFGICWNNSFAWMLLLVNPAAGSRGQLCCSRHCSCLLLPKIPSWHSAWQHLMGH